MKRQAAFWLAWSVCALALVLIGCFFILAFLNHASLEDLSFPIVGISSAVVGGVVASRRPGNPVGWIFLGSALIVAFRSLTGEYAVYGITTNPGLPLVPFIAWLSVSVRMVAPVLSFVLLPLYFPNGKLVSPRWRPVVWLTLAVTPVAIVLDAMLPSEAIYDSGIQNPVGIEALRPVADFLAPILFVVYMSLIFVSAASLVARYLYSGVEERQQIKWFTFAAATIPVWFVVNSPIQAAFPNLFAMMDALIIAGVPVAAGIAVLRYRLYDIDIIINRALVYALLTVMLGATYFASVVLLQQSLRFLTNHESQLAIVASTLTIAALFSPLRRRVQEFIDRRFYRGKYDAEKALREFNARLRDETDLDELSRDLVSVVRETVRPEHATLWFCSSQDSRAEEKREFVEVFGESEFRNVRDTVDH